MIPIKRLHSKAMYYSFKAKQSKGLQRLKYYYKASYFENLAVRVYFEEHLVMIRFSEKPPESWKILLRSAFWLNLKALRLHWAFVYLIEYKLL